MTASEILQSAAVAGCDVHLREDGTPAINGRPNAALLAALKMHRREVIAALGGTPPAFELEKCTLCKATVYDLDAANICEEGNLCILRTGGHR